MHYLPCPWLRCGAVAGAGVSGQDENTWLFFLLKNKVFYDEIIVMNEWLKLYHLKLRDLRCFSEGFGCHEEVIWWTLGHFLVM